VEHTIKILVLCFSDLKRDPRVFRQLLALSTEQKYKIYAAGWTDPELDSVKYIKLPKFYGTKLSKLTSAINLKLGGYEKYYWNNKNHKTAYQVLKTYKFDLILANDIDALPLSVKIASEHNAKLIYDAHEYTPREFENNWKWRFFYQKYKTYLCKTYLPLTDAMITVCDGIAQKYNKHFNVNPVIVTNAPNYVNLSPSPVDDNKIRIIHHGAALPARNLELMIEMAKYLDVRFELDFMLVANNYSYLNELKKMARNYQNINFIEPVAMPEIAQQINSYDIGLFILPPNNFNYAMALPNKLFEFIQARLMIAIGPSPEMAKYVTQYSLGIIAKNFSPKTMADELNKLTISQIMQFKANSSSIAKQLSFEENQSILLDLVSTTLKASPCVE
jgi:glycosyltransferase involved in cell wall biosynthesis